MDVQPIHYASLCTGAAGLDIGVHLALERLGRRPICHLYVEREAFAVHNLAEKIRTGILDPAPIWSDLGSVASLDLDRRLDLIVAGIPCQPHSAAGQRKGQADPRDLWPITRRLLGVLRPQYLFLENVAGITHGTEPYLGRICGDLSADGWNAEWTTLSAAAVGAPHRRNRLFLLAHLAVTDSERRRPWPDPERPPRPPRTRQYRSRLFPPPPHSPAAWRRLLETHPLLEPAIRRKPHGIPHRVDRIRLLGNAVVPIQAATAFLLLWNRLHSS